MTVKNSKNKFFRNFFKILKVLVAFSYNFANEFMFFKAIKMYPLIYKGICIVKFLCDQNLKKIVFSDFTDYKYKQKNV